MPEAAGFTEWMSFLETRHLADLTFQEVSRSLRSLSSTYVERRRKLHEGAALAGAGKRAAFALFYGPLHFLLVRHIVSSVPELTHIVHEIVDLGCGTGAAGAAWASECAPAARVHGVDRHPCLRATRLVFARCAGAPSNRFWTSIADRECAHAV